MNYHLKSSVQRPRYRFRFFVFFVLVLLVLSYIAPPSFLTRLAHTGVIPFWRAGNAGADLTASIASLSESKQSLIRKNEALREQVEDMQLRLLDRNLLREENLELKEILGRVGDEKTVLARVLTKPNRSAYDTIVIDVGTENHVSVGDKVLVSNSIVIGRIAEAFGHSALVVLFSSPGETIDVSIGTTGVVAAAHGRGAGNFSIDVPRDVEVQIGDTIIAPGISEKIFGTVGDLFIEPSNSFKTVLFQSPVNIFELRWVQVITSADVEVIEVE